MFFRIPHPSKKVRFLFPSLNDNRILFCPGGIEKTKKRYFVAGGGIGKKRRFFYNVTSENKFYLFQTEVKSVFGGEIENKNKAIAEKEVLVQESAKRARIAADTAERKQIMQEMMQPLSKDHKEIMGALLESVKTDKLQNAFNKYLPSVLKEDAKKPQKKVLSESVTEVTGDKAKASASADKQTADIVYLQKLAGIS